MGLAFRRRPPTLPTDPAVLHANVAARALACVVDAGLCLFLTAALGGLLEPLLPAATVNPLLFPLLLWLLWSGGIASPWQASPGKLLLGLRVIGRDGGRPGAGPVALRSLLLLAELWLLVAIGGFHWYSPWQAAGYLGLFALGLATLTPRRQAAHDLLTGTLVVGRRAFAHPDAAALLADPDFVCTRGWKGWFDQAANLLVLLLGVAILWMAGSHTHERDRYARIRYAVDQARELSPRLLEFHRERGRFPRDGAELGVPAQQAYPAGGHWALEADGRIRIRFGRLPDLVADGIVLQARVEDERLLWTCRSDNPEIARRLPHGCR